MDLSENIHYLYTHHSSHLLLLLLVDIALFPSSSQISLHCVIWYDFCAIILGTKGGGGGGGGGEGVLVKDMVISSWSSN